MRLTPHPYPENYHISFPKMERSTMLSPRTSKVLVKAQVPWLGKAVCRVQALPTGFPGSHQTTSVIFFFLPSGPPEAAGQAV